MFKKSIIAILIVCFSVGSMAQAQDDGMPEAPGKPILTDDSQPQIEGFTGRFVAGEQADLSGLHFGNRGLLSNKPGPVSRDDGLTRVVLLGDAPIFTNCRLLHELKTTEWTPQAIKLEFSFPLVTPGTDLYLFVIDAEGTPSVGLGPLVEGAGMPERSTGPGQPGKPSTF
jgi:hypothetical protein